MSVRAGTPLATESINYIMENVKKLFSLFSMVLQEKKLMLELLLTWYKVRILFICHDQWVIITWV